MASHHGSSSSSSSLSRRKSGSSSNHNKSNVTAKQFQRHYVVHDYVDHGAEAEDPTASKPPVRRGGVEWPFPLRLHQVLERVERDGYADIISWQPHGRCFVVHKPKQFVQRIISRYFNQSKLTSFQRQLNLYGFRRLTRGPDTGAYYHECFLRGKPFLTSKMVRTRVKGTRIKASNSPDQEPDFYAMPTVLTSRSSSSMTAIVSNDEQSCEATSSSGSVASISQPPVHQGPPQNLGVQQPVRLCSAAPIPLEPVRSSSYSHELALTLPSLQGYAPLPVANLTANPVGTLVHRLDHLTHPRSTSPNSADTSHLHPRHLYDPVDEMIMELQDVPLVDGIQGFSDLWSSQHRATCGSRHVVTSSADVRLGYELDAMLHDPVYEI